MKKKYMAFVLFAALVLAFAGCNKDDATGRDEAAGGAATEGGKTVIRPEEEKQDASAGGGREDSDTVSEDEAAVSDELEKRTLTCAEETFLNAERYVSSAADKARVLSYALDVYKPYKRKGDEKVVDIHEEIKARSENDIYKKLRFLRADKNGATMDIGVYMDPGSLYIDRIIAEEYCADGREVTDYCFDEGKLVWAYRYMNDRFGAAYIDEKLPGKKCWFSDERMTGCIIDDSDVDFKEREYLASSYDMMDEFSRASYDELEAEMLKRAYITYESVRSVPGFAVIYGYVGDEFGGYLSHVQMTISSKANRYESEFETNGDGYFEVMVPINNEDRYGVTCEYGDYTISTVDDINIVPGTLEYCLGVIYMAEPGKGVHEANTYLLNANYTSPKHLGEGEYCVVFDYEDKSADLKPFVMNLKSSALTSDSMAVIKPGKDDQFRYYVTDQRGGRSGNPMTYEMSTSRAYVRIYDTYGLIAAYQVPAGKAGTVWEVFGIKDGKIIPINNYLIEASAEPFFS